MDRFACCIHQSKVWFEGHLKSSGAYHNIQLMHFIVSRKDSLGYDLGDFGVEDRLYVGLHEGLEIAVSGRDAPAARSPFRNDELLQLVVAFAHATKPGGVSISAFI